MRTFLNYESSRISNLYPICARADKILVLQYFIKFRIMNNKFIN